MGSLPFLRNSLPVQSCISFASATFSVKQTLLATLADWKCTPLTCRRGTTLSQTNGIPPIIPYFVILKYNAIKEYTLHYNKHAYGSCLVAHYSGVIMGAIASQITSLTILYSTMYSGADQRKHQSSASPAFVRGIHRRPVKSLHKRPITRKMVPFDDVIMDLIYGLVPDNWCSISPWVTVLAIVWLPQSH